MSSVPVRKNEEGRLQIINLDGPADGAAEVVRLGQRRDGASAP